MHKKMQINKKHKKNLQKMQQQSIQLVHVWSLVAKVESADEKIFLKCEKLNAFCLIQHRYSVGMICWLVFQLTS